MSDDTVVVEDDTGNRREMEIQSAGRVTCPECGSKGPERVDIHNLNRVLAGECAVCYHTWTIGVDNELEVVDDA